MEYITDDLNALCDELRHLREHVNKFLLRHCEIYYSGDIRIDKNCTQYRNLGLIELFVEHNTPGYAPDSGVAYHIFAGYFVVAKKLGGENVLIEIPLSGDLKVYLLPITYLTMLTNKRRFDAIVRERVLVNHYKMEYVDEQFLLEYCNERQVPISKREDLVLIADFGVSVYQKTEIKNVFIAIDFIGEGVIYRYFHDPNKWKYEISYLACVESDIRREFVMMNGEQRKMFARKYASVLGALSM